MVRREATVEDIGQVKVWPNIVDYTSNWDWGRITNLARDRYVIAEPSGAVCSIAVGRRRVRLLRDGDSLEPYYRLDFILRRPDESERGMGAVLFAAVCYRTLVELEAVGLILNGVPQKRRHWLKMGATQGSPPGWHPSRNMVPFHVTGEALEDKAGWFDAFLL